MLDFHGVLNLDATALDGRLHVAQLVQHDAVLAIYALYLVFAHNVVEGDLAWVHLFTNGAKVLQRLAQRLLWKVGLVEIGRLASNLYLVIQVDVGSLLAGLGRVLLLSLKVHLLAVCDGELFVEHER